MVGISLLTLVPGVVGGSETYARELVRALARIGESPEHILLVAFGFKYDIAPAQSVGCRAAWVNRFVEARPGGYLLAAE